MILIKNDVKYKQYEYKSEDEFEKEIVLNSRLFFGKSIIYIEVKKKIESRGLGGSVPDAFLFDLTDLESPNFYLVEIELARHDFYRHVFPQITRFFAFFKSDKNRTELVEKIFSIINSDADLKQEFKAFLGEKEIYKFIKDVVEDSQNILLIMDGEKRELPEIMETYSDTWGKMVKLLTLKKFINNRDCIYLLNPEFETIEVALEAPISDIEIQAQYSEEFHLESLNEQIKATYLRIKKELLKYNKDIKFNPQKYYISIVYKKNIAFFKFRKKTFGLVIMLPEKEIRRKIHKHRIKKLSEGVQNFYNGPCAEVIIENSKNIKEVVSLIKLLAPIRPDRSISIKNEKQQS